MPKHLCAKKVPIFNHLEHEHLVYITDIMTHKIFKKGELLFSPEKPCGLMIIAKGSVKIYQLNRDGKEQLLRIAMQGEVIGEDSLFDTRNSVCYGQAMANGEACTLDKDRFRELLLKYPSISLKLLEEYGSRIREIEQHAFNLQNSSVKGRLANYLVQLSQHENSLKIHLPVSKKALADLLGSVPETISRRLKELTEENLIKVNHQDIEIIDIKGLEKLRNE